MVKGYLPAQCIQGSSCCRERDYCEAPRPPTGDSKNWQLQYVKWSGWTWVQATPASPCSPRSTEKLACRPKTTASVCCSVSEAMIPRTPRGRRKRRRCRWFCCFRRRSSEEICCPPPLPPERPDYYTKPPPDFYNKPQECCCCCCCCCCDDGYLPSCESGLDVCSPQKMCQVTETQTIPNVKEKSTKISEFRFKNTEKKCCCCCCRNRCCRQRRARACCNSNQPREKSPKCTIHTKRSDPRTVNYCLTDFKKKPTINDPSRDPLDLLLKNNINIAKIFDQGNNTTHKKLTFFNIGDIPEREFRKSDPKHCRILTEVCDAILSNHKFDDRKYNPLDMILKATTSTSTDNSNDSINVPLYNEALRKVLNKNRLSLDSRLETLAAPNKAKLRRDQQKVSSRNMDISKQLTIAETLLHSMDLATGSSVTCNITEELEGPSDNLDSATASKSDGSNSENSSDQV